MENSKVTKSDKPKVIVTSEGTLNIQSFYDAYIKLGFDRVVKKHEGDINKKATV